MAITKFLNDIVLDGAVDVIVAQADKVIMADSYHANFSALDAAKVGEYAVGTITKANGDESGRKATVPAKTGVNISANGHYQHLFVVNSATSTILAVTGGTRKEVYAGDKLDVPQFDIEISDVTQPAV